MPDDNRLPTNQSLIDLKDSIDLLTANINRTASNIPYDDNVTIKAAIDGKVSKSGDTMTGNLNVNKGSAGGSNIFIGGVESQGAVKIYDNTGHSVNVYPYNLTADRQIKLPDNDGTLALTSEITFEKLKSGTWAWGSQATYSIEATGAKSVIVYGARNGRGFLLICPNNNAEYLSVFNNTGCSVSHTFDSNTNKHTITLSNPTSTTGSSIVVTVIG